VIGCATCVAFGRPLTISMDRSGCGASNPRLTSSEDGAGPGLAILVPATNAHVGTSRGLVEALFPFFPSLGAGLKGVESRAIAACRLAGGDERRVP
jgi:hypothetical protein